MANYKIEITNSAHKEIRRLDPQIIPRIIEKIEDLLIDQFPVGHKKLIARNGYRIRIGDYRVIYDVIENESLIKVYKVGHRKDIYD